MLSTEMEDPGKERAAHRLYGRGGGETQQPITGQGETVPRPQLSNSSSLEWAFLQALLVEEITESER